MSDAPGEGTGRGVGARLASAAVALGTGTVLALAVWLEPAPAGHGTHQQLGLPPCTFLLMTGWPCPMCGATTTFSLLAHGRLLEGVWNHPFAAALAVVTAAVFGVAVAEVIQPRARWARIHAQLESKEGWIAAGTLLAMVFSWGLRIARAAFG